MTDTELTPELYELLSGQNLSSKQQEALVLMTVSEDGWPHTAMISVGEVAAVSRNMLRLGLWPGTATTGNMLRTGKATLAAFYAGKAFYTRLQLRPLAELAGAKHPRQRFEAQVVSVKADTAKYAEIRSGVQIVLHEPEAVVTRWEETVEELLK
ncbi:pyridoxamine 5'-phosphate oxidase family protein [Paenibacillus sp. YPG26]|uniref:pyridoxamine 5'-phosphate oxidase family protein n=1 Tax=Paenibacillus sp. YPG26 TaxID=2878915 RepID=UPI00203AB745|nr:pyridoxamine 5'-phosphate oxidase family protein [Paenibacillus sp. YPG26]USB33597.1 pyridoxamine 5'-phosphate oxidase family protein [Paenibacillus sp. YPG26]